MELRGDDLFIPRHEHYEIESFIDGSFMTLADAPWPGLTPDLLSVLIVVATQAKGSVLFHQKMFESRLSLQDWLSIDEHLRLADADAERINIPANPRHYWRYRMHLTIEQLLASEDFNQTVKELVKNSGR